MSITPIGCNQDYAEDYSLVFAFDQYVRAWKVDSSDPTYNLEFLLGMQELAQKMLDTSPTGVLYLSQVLELLTIRPTKESRRVGWNRYYGCGRVSFGLNPDEWSCQSDKYDMILFLNGQSQEINIRFNVDGPLVGMFAPKRAIQK